MSLRSLLSIVPLTSGQITLREPQPADAETIARYIEHEGAEAWLSGSANADGLYSEYRAGWDLPDEPNRLGLTLIVTRSGDDTLVGVVHLEPGDGVLHVGYGVAPNHRRLGVASKALALCSAWAIESGFSRVELEIGEDNIASQAVARRCGFEPTSRTRIQDLPDGGEWHARTWAMSPSDGAVDGLRIVVLGPPGSGKGTHARSLAERYDILHVSTGAMLRREMATESPLGVRVSSAVHAGRLVDDAVIVELVRTAVTSPAARLGWVLDGAPRSVEQAELLTPVFEAVGVMRVIAIALDVPVAELRRRLAERGDREARADDAAEVVEQRFEVWAATGPALLAWYERRGLLELVDGVGSVDDVAARVVAAVERRRVRDAR